MWPSPEPATREEGQGCGLAPSQPLGWGAGGVALTCCTGLVAWGLGCLEVGRGKGGGTDCCFSLAKRAKGA